jgi:cytochrome c556
MNMRKRSAKRNVTALVSALLLCLAAAVFAHEGMEHGGKRMGEAMARQHRLMAMYARTAAEIDESLKKGDAAAVEAGTRKILVSIPELKRMRPHKNLKERNAFPKIAAAFAADIKAVAANVKKGDFPGAMESFRSAEGKCNECHAKFRD